MSRRDIEAGRAHITLWVKKSAFVKGLQAAERRLKSFGSGLMKLGGGIAAAGASILAPMGLAVKAFADVGDELDKMSLRTGIGVAALSELGFAAEQSGQDLDTIEKAIRRMQKTIGDAHRGLSTAVDGLEKLGLAASDLDGLAPDEQFDLLAERIAEIEDPTARASAAMDVFGSRTGTALLPMLENMKELREEARQLGLPPTEEQTKRAAALTDAINRVRRVVGAAIFQLGDTLAPVIQRVSQAILDMAKPTLDWVRANQGVVRTIAAIGAALVVTGGVVAGFGAAFFLAGSAVAGVVTIITTLASVVSTIGLPFIAAGGAVIAFTGALAGAGAAWLAFTDSGQAAVGILREIFGNITSVATESIGAIVEALKAGDIEAALEIAGLALEVIWLESLQTLRNGWQGFVEKLAIDFYKMVDSIGEYFQKNMLDILAAAANPAAAIAEFAVGGAQAAGEAASPLFMDDNTAQAEIDAKRDELAAAIAPQQAKIDARNNRNAPVLAPAVSPELLANNDPRSATVNAPMVNPLAVEHQDRLAAERKRYQSEIERLEKADRERQMQMQQSMQASMPSMEGMEQQAKAFVSFSAAGLGLQGNGGRSALEKKADEQINLAKEAGKLLAQGVAETAKVVNRIDSILTFS